MCWAAMRAMDSRSRSSPSPRVSCSRGVSSNSRIRAARARGVNGVKVAIAPAESALYSAMSGVSEAGITSQNGTERRCDEEVAGPSRLTAETGESRCGSD
jgi:hypothetical protein